MSLPPGIDPDLLRTFAFIAEEGSFTRAAERVGRTQSAVSMQVQRLEALLGQKVLQRGKGGTVTLTAHGQYLLEHGRALLALNDSIWAAFRTPQMHGRVRLGSPDDYALRFLPPVLKRFADSHPGVEVDVMCASSDRLTNLLRDGDLDIALVSEGQEPLHWPAEVLWRGPLVWITSERHNQHRQDPLPLALAQEDCAWRLAALNALERAGRRWRVAYTAGTQIGTQAPVMAGLAVTVSTLQWLPDGLRPVRSDEGLPGLPDSGILMVQAREPRSAAAIALAAHIRDTFSREISRQDRAA